jgi:xanthine dehydrogenase accessory factor
VTNLWEISIVIKGAGEMASGVAWRLYMANFKNILMLETAVPAAVRREVSFCEAIYDGSQTVEGVKAIKADTVKDIHAAWAQGDIAVAADPQWHLIKKIRPQVLVDAILAKKNLGTRLQDAGVVIGLGPGFNAGADVHMVIETNRGHDLGRIITSGFAGPNTGVPGAIAGITADRVLRSPADGLFKSEKSIGDSVAAGEVIGSVGEQMVTSKIDGVLRGLIRPQSMVAKGLKIGDVDPRGRREYCRTISEKARAIAGSVLEAILRTFNAGRPAEQGPKVDPK